MVLAADAAVAAAVAVRRILSQLQAGVLASIRTSTADGRLTRYLTERALLVVLAADAAVAVAVAMAELAVNLIVVRQIVMELQGSLLPTQAGVLARIRTSTAEGRLKRNLTERALLVVLESDCVFDVSLLCWK